MNYWHENVELSFSKLICKFRIFSPTLDLIKKKCCFHLYYLKCHIKQQFLMTIFFSFSFSVTLFFQETSEFLVFILFMYVVCTGKRLNLMIRFSSAINLLTSLKFWVFLPILQWGSIQTTCVFQWQSRRTSKNKAALLSAFCFLSTFDSRHGESNLLLAKRYNQLVGLEGEIFLERPFTLALKAKPTCSHCVSK